MKCDSSKDTKILSVLLLILWTLTGTRGVPLNASYGAGLDETIQLEETRVPAKPTADTQEKLPIALIKKMQSRNAPMFIAKLLLQLRNHDANDTLILTALSKETVVLKCFTGNENICSNQQNCQVRWFKGEQKKRFREIQAYDRGNSKRERWVRKEGKFAKNVSRIGTKLVLEMVGPEDAGMYACCVRAKGNGKRTSKGDFELASLLGEAKEEVMQMILLRVISQKPVVAAGEKELGGNVIQGEGQSDIDLMQVEEGIGKHLEGDENENGSDSPIALKFGMIKYFFSLGTILSNLAFFAVIISILSCLCCGSFCCC